MRIEICEVFLKHRRQLWYILIDRIMSGQSEWILPPLIQPLEVVLAELQGVSKGGLEEEKEGDQEEVKGLKFISNRLIRLFERNRKLKYTHISKILIDNFSSESNDSRNIKRRVYDAINVMVAAGLFSKNGDMLQKKQSFSFREKVEVLKTELNNEHTHRQAAVNNKKLLLNRLAKRKCKLAELMHRNRGAAENKKDEKISNPVIVNLREGLKRVQVKCSDQEVCNIEMGRSWKGRAKGGAATELLKDQQYLQYL